MLNKHLPILPGLLLALVAAARPWLEATMARHMAIELPMLFVIGWLTAHAAGLHSRPSSRWNANGVPALLAAMAVTGFWMLPVALDLAVLNAGMGIVKVVTMLGAGLLAAASWRAAGLFVQAFFVLNGVWMSLTAGFLYQDAPQQLCSVYLADQQAAAGKGVVFLSLTVLFLWLAATFHQLIAQESGPQAETGSAAAS
jgi:hypothetical protein